MISTDRNIFDHDSAVAKRMISYGKTFGELHIVVFGLVSLKLEAFSLSPEVFVYPTQSQGRLNYINDAVLVSKQIAESLYIGQTIISAQDPFETGLAGVKIKKKTKLPLQIQIHTDFCSKQFYDGSLLNWVRFQISRFTLPHADGVRVVREKIAQDLVLYRKIDKRKITVLPIFVDINKLRANPISVDLKMKYPEFQSVVLMASRLTSEKSVSTGIRAFAKVASKINGLGLVIVGEGNQEQKLRSLVKHLGVGDRFRFENWQHDLSSYYKTANLFMNTSLFEGYGMSLVEATAVGCPVLTTNVGIAQDYFIDGRNALVCPVGDIDCLSNKLITFFANTSIQKSIGEEGYNLMTRQIISEEMYLNQYKESLEFILQTK
jgi:glycosyltransferase involved in cell wall biosynthesis